MKKNHSKSKRKCKIQTQIKRNPTKIKPNPNQAKPESSQIQSEAEILPKSNGNPAESLEASRAKAKPAEPSPSPGLAGPLRRRSGDPAETR